MECSAWKRDERRLEHYVIGYFIFQALNLFVKLVLGDFPGWSLLTRGILMILLVLALLPMFRRAGTYFVIAEMALFAIYFYGYFLETVTLSALSSVMFDSMVVFLPMGICMLCIEDLQQFFNSFYHAALLMQGILSVTLIYVGNGGNHAYSMSAGYSLLLHTLFIMAHWFQKHVWYDLLIAGADLAVMLFFGSRGAILCIGFFFVLHILYQPDIGLKKKFSILSCLFALIIMIGLLYMQICIALNALLERFGYFSRTLQLIIRNEMVYDSGRVEIYQYYIQKIWERPLLGWGPLGGRAAAYPHNVFIELIVSFGIPIGILISVALVVGAFNALRKKSGVEHLLVCIFVAINLSLLISGSIYTANSFFVCMALCCPSRKRTTLDEKTSYMQRKKSIFLKKNPERRL